MQVPSTMFVQLAMLSYSGEKSLDHLKTTGPHLYNWMRTGRDSWNQLFPDSPEAEADQKISARVATDLGVPEHDIMTCHILRFFLFEMLQLLKRLSFSITPISNSALSIAHTENLLPGVGGDNPFPFFWYQALPRNGLPPNQEFASH